MPQQLHACPRAFRLRQGAFASERLVESGSARKTLLFRLFSHFFSGQEYRLLTCRDLAAVIGFDWPCSATLGGQPKPVNEGHLKSGQQLAITQTSVRREGRYPPTWSNALGEERDSKSVGKDGRMICGERLNGRPALVQKRVQVT